MATSTFGFPLTYPRFKAFTSANAPGVGYLLNTYEAGTTNPLATYPTYADALAGTNANANPVVMDALGEATIFGQGGKAYKLILTDPSAVVLWTVDAIVLTDVPKSQTTVVKNGGQALGVGFTKLTSWAVQTDALSEWNAGTNTWTATYAGKYYVELTVEMTNAVTAVTTPQCAIYMNAGQVARGSLFTSAINQFTTVVAHYTWVAAAGDTIEAYATGLNVNTTAQTGLATRLTIIGIA
jgi:hypothetical protein